MTGALAVLVPCAIVSTLASAAVATTPEPSPRFELVGRYVNGGSEVSAVFGNKLFVLDDGAAIDIVDITKPSQPAHLTDIDLSLFGASVTSVATSKKFVAVTLPAADKTDPGTLVILDHDGTVLAKSIVGANPDMVTFTKNGTVALVANEGEPNSYEPADDPEGSVSIVDVAKLVKGKSNAVRTAGFAQFNEGGSRHAQLPAGIRVFGPGASVAQDLEPEYITVDGDRAFVTLQEANAIAEIDIADARVSRIRVLALKDHSVAGNGLDASDRDGGVNIVSWPVSGVPMPDAVKSFEVKGKTYLITANEGDARADWPGYAEEIRVGSKDYKLDPTVFPNAAELKLAGNLGRLTVSKASGDLDGDGDFDRIDAFGTRSATIWKTNGTRVWDSGDSIERTTAGAHLDYFNVSNSDNDLDSRSDNKGPEPEGVAVGTVGKRTLAFVGLERTGGFVVYDVTNPESPSLTQYANNRDFTADPESAATDSGPEVITFVDAKSSPTKKPLVIVNNEVSHSVTIWSLTN